MAKPDVTISAPPTLFVGKPFTIEIDVAAGKETKVDFIDATLTCQEGWTVGSGKSQISHAIKTKLVTSLMGPGVLPAESTTRFSAAFVLPESTPPTHYIKPAHASVRLRIHVSIPWRIDGRYHYNFAVRIPPPGVVQRTPHRIRSTPPTAAADTPRIELGLASTRLIAGETLVGTCAVFHLDDREPREVELSLVPVFKLLGRGRTREMRGTALTSTLILPAGSAGTSVPFTLELPRTMTPSFEAATQHLDWWLVAMSGSFFRGKVDVSVPLEIVDASATATTARLTEAPRLGDEQVATRFAQFAARYDWQGSEPSRTDEPEDDRLAGQFSIERAVGDSHVQIAYAYRGKEGTFLVASVEHPSLGLGLAVQASSTLRHVFFEDVEVDIAAWDRAHHVTVRTPAQAIPFLRKVAPAMMGVSRLGTLVRWSDDAMIYEVPVTSVEDEELAAIGAELDLLSRTVEAARILIPPPPSVTTDLGAWHALAERVGGRLHVGDLSLSGTSDGLPVDLGLAWDAEGHPVAVHVVVGDPAKASGELRAQTLSLRRPASDILGANVAEALVELLTRWPVEFVDLRVIDGVASAALALAAGEPVVVDAGRVRELVEALRGVLAALDPGAGPYR